MIKFKDDSGMRNTYQIDSKIQISCQTLKSNRSDKRAIDEL